jgi:hypothetical protein
MSGIASAGRLMVSAGLVILALSFIPGTSSPVSTISLPPSLPGNGWSIYYSGTLSVREDFKVLLISSGPLQFYALSTNASDVLNWMEAAFSPQQLQACMNIASPNSSICLLGFINSHPHYIFVSREFTAGSSEETITPEPLAVSADISLYVVNPTETNESLSLGSTEISSIEAQGAGLIEGTLLTLVGIACQGAEFLGKFRGKFD